MIIGGLGTLIALACGAWFVNNNQMSVGDLLAFYTLLAQLHHPLLRLTQFHATFAGTRVAVERIAESLEEPEWHANADSTLIAPSGQLEFCAVSFRYHPGGPPVLCDIRFSVRPGMKVAILGDSGAGKSTLLALIPRLYDARDGSIRIDGKDIRRLRLSDLRRAALLVPQHSPLFLGTLRSNLIYGRPNAGELELKGALQMAALDDFVAGLPLGLETPVGDRGTTLSGGQRQRLALARAIISNPSILLLDDSTSALDAQTEAAVLRGLRATRPECTCLHATHRVLTALDCDWVIMLDRGRIVEQGHPDQLLEASGPFRRLYDGQAFDMGARLPLDFPQPTTGAT